MNFEDILQEAGSFGKFQIFMLFLLCLPRFILPFHFLLHNFLAAIPSHHCAIPHQEQFANLTEEEVLLINIPRDFEGAFSSCEMFSEPQFHLLLNATQEPANTSSVQSCQHGWVYDQSQFTSTVATQWDLVCEQRSLNQATATFFFIGVTIGAVIFGYLSDRWVSESARWFLTKGKLKQAHKHLQRCAKMNGQNDFGAKINLEILSKTAAAAAARAKSRGDSSYVSLFRTLMLRRISLCMGALWFGVAFSYYGMSMNITGFGLGMYMTQFVFGVIEIPAKLIVLIAVNRIGRKQCQAWSLILAGLCIGANIVIPTSLGTLRSVVAITGKGFSEAAFTMVFLYTPELYPTVLRQKGLGYCSFVARLGGSVAPLIFLLDTVWKLLPQVTYCAMAVLCGSVAFLLPETLNVRLPETIEDIEKQSSEGKQQPPGDVFEVMPLHSLQK
ncbi:solute carrier family 22 member 7-like isoform X3 [Eublepharis macularius]|uniref:Solute carrier family 22 member 7-like isoform X3 n=1 Tax=Eublepharis macularius TaxID=481883 RepID=A0AA97JV47_EUBMA|nr:solute carrier family 22 member 7-like isoform X3 [Eublepharis macularius]